MQTRKNQDLTELQLEVKIKFPFYLESNPLIKKYISDKNSHENYIENLFRNVILVERYARNKILINIEVLEINCDLIPYAVLGISLALNEANIEQKGICTAANIIRKENELIIDPTFEEEIDSEFKLLWGCLYDLDENTLYIQRGSIDDENLKNVLFIFLN
jgi:ribonuclease PH